MVYRPRQDCSAHPELMVTIFVCYDRKGSRDLFLTGQLIVSLKIEEKIFHIRIRQSAGIPAPAQVLYNVYPVCQEIKPDGIPQEWIAAEHNPAVVDGVGCFSLSVTERLCRTSSTLCSGAMASAALITACWVAGDKL